MPSASPARLAASAYGGCEMRVRLTLGGTSVRQAAGAGRVAMRHLDEALGNFVLDVAEHGLWEVSRRLP